ncbi:MAG: hypothetical protein M0C28_24565 [Candidatus Moduliflexus flocculans]|nr:hypothetical protein [Candidatus Moduliflexus flocculans]
MLVLDASPPPAYADEAHSGRPERRRDERMAAGRRRARRRNGQLPVVGREPGEDASCSTTRAARSWRPGSSSRCYYHGFPAEGTCSILDGGLAKWQAARLPVTKDADAGPEAGQRSGQGAQRGRAGPAAGVPGRVRRPGQPRAARGPGAPTGTSGGASPFDRAGHPPERRHASRRATWFNPDKTFKSPDELRRMLALPGHPARAAGPHATAAAASLPACRSSR